MPRAPQAFKNHPMSFDVAREDDGFRAVCQYTVDGDTIDCMIDVGFRHYPYVAIRLAGVDTPEIFRPKSVAEKELGWKALEFVNELLMDKPVFLIITGHSFDRYVANVWYWKDNGQMWLLSDELKAQHLTKADVPKD